MGILEFIVLCAVLGVVAYLVTTYIPMPQPVKTVIIVAVVLVLVLVLIRALIGDIQIPRLR